jgi:very-short-patch-repair endonuclease
VRDLALDLRAAGGATTRGALRGLGHTHAAIRSAVDAGSLVAIGRSWVLLSDTDPSIAEALRAGGVLGGASALRSYGIWVTHPTRVQVATPPHAGRSASTSVDRLWVPFTPDALPWRVTVIDALAQHAAVVEREHAIACIDSALHQGLLPSRELEPLFRMLPRRCSSWSRLLDSSAESGLESLVRVPCLLRGWGVETQAPAPGGGRSDLLLDGWLYVEADGSEWHDDPKQAAKDRRRNKAITAAGGRWLRFGYADVVHDIDGTMRVIEGVLSDGRPRSRMAG